MSYLVLARKWRPKRFDQLVGQEHVVRALTNALESGRVHHAFLFTGTRGVGKTTIARIFAKSLNCEKGAGAEPCGECPSCLDIDAGRFIDLLEIDAASNNGVDEVRSLIENAQYMPARGRSKVYLIDEVHMLSKPAFNALLKTLEEPPGHVKFLLATTDPQKLPMTVLSRCLQFNLRRLEQAQIAGQMEMILQSEQIAFEPGALGLLARAADGSLRDGLSLLDQAIAFTGGQLLESGINAMLGSVERAQVGELLEALCTGNGMRLMAEVAGMAQYSPDFASVLGDLAIELHQVQLRQLVPGYEGEPSRIDSASLAGRLTPEVVQLWYQMAVNGRRDLGAAPSPRAGFEMALLRMLAFRPSGDVGHLSPAEPRSAPARPAATPPATPPTPPVLANPAPTASAPSPASSATAVAKVSAVARVQADAPPTALHNGEDWLQLLARASLKGPVLQLASHSAFCTHEEGVLRLFLAKEDLHLRSDNLVRQLSSAVCAQLGAETQIRFEAAASAAGDTLHARNQRQRSERQIAAEASFLADPVVNQLLGQGGSLVPDSIRPNNEN